MRYGKIGNLRKYAKGQRSVGKKKFEWDAFNPRLTITRPQPTTPRVGVPRKRIPWAKSPFGQLGHMADQGEDKVNFQQHISNHTQNLIRLEGNCTMG